MVETSPTPDAPRAVSLDDKWILDTGRIVLNGSQAIARVLLAQAALDHVRGLRTAGYVTGYRGSPLGNVDNALWSVAARFDAAGIVFQPGLNEDIAATAVRGTQQLDQVPGAKYDGVFAAWYGKGPGIDRSGDALKHGNYAGAHPRGGVLVFYGDDHAAKSSTIAHQSEQAVAAALIPSLFPADVAEVIQYGLLGIAMSRYSGSWVGIKCVTEVAEQTATVDLDLPAFSAILPPGDPGENIHIQHGCLDPVREERIVIEQRLPRVHAFVRANHIDRAVMRAAKPGLGIVTAGKAYGDTRAGLVLLGLTEARATALGVSLYKVGCIWPLEPTGLAEFAAGQRALLVIEEKKSFLEAQIAAALINRADRPLVIGKVDEDGGSLMSSTAMLDAAAVARVIAGRMQRLGLADAALLTALDALPPPPRTAPLALRRTPFFCSGCPHSRSTRVPDGSISMTGIGCHTMVNGVRPDEALLPTHMGGEGANWIGLAPFTGTGHIFQNMGDGTYYHSGLIAIRAAVAAKVNITYKILYNDAVAMTGGQPIDGPISVADIARQVRDEGVGRIVVLSDDPTRHAGTAFPEGLRVGHRDELDAVQRELREVPGTTVLIYEQTCAAEKRRRRKKKEYPDPAKRLFISKAVCEGCGDCSVQSTCVSLAPVETAFGRKRQIDQSSCNKDYSCLNGFCPSFITVYGAEPRKPQAVAVDDGVFAALSVPARAPLGPNGFNLLIAGIGGTGVVTVGALIGMAAHIEGRAMSLFDMTGLSQKNGAVYSHVRLAATPGAIHGQRVARGAADLLLAFDLVAALASEAADTVRPGHTRAIANASVSPTRDFQFDRDHAADPALLLARLRDAAGPDALDVVDATATALAVLGDTIGANLFLVGVAAQRGLLPVGVEAIAQAVRLNGVAVGFNLRAFGLGRLFAADPERVCAMAQGAVPAVPKLPATLAEVVAHRTRHLTDYQNAAFAERYAKLVERVRAAEAHAAPGSQALTLAVARNYAKLLAYKDEYEVARLLTHPALRAELARSFEDGGRIALNLAPPILGGKPVNGRPRKREFGAWMLPVMRVLARGKRLRGTAFDPFGRSAERRAERALIADYEALVERTLAALTPANHAAAVERLAMVDQVRGFGPVKHAAMAAYAERAAAADVALRQPDARVPVPAR